LEKMVRKKRHGAPEIEAKLLEVEALSAKGQTQAEIGKALGISVMTIHRWRKMREQAKTTPEPPPTIGRHEGDTVDPARIAELQLENARLRKLVTDLLLEKMRLEDEQVAFHPGAGNGNGKSAIKRSVL
jgi:putative transposase